MKPWEKIQNKKWNLFVRQMWRHILLHWTEIHSIFFSLLKLPKCPIWLVPNFSKYTFDIFFLTHCSKVQLWLSASTLWREFWDHYPYMTPTKQSTIKVKLHWNCACILIEHTFQTLHVEGSRAMCGPEESEVRRCCNFTCSTCMINI